jgi:predicted  nucleic acid-binding Zn-ribbon protein
MATKVGDVVNSKEGINQSKSQTQEELDNVKQRNKKNQTHQQKERQKITTYNFSKGDNLCNTVTYYHDI